MDAVLVSGGGDFAPWEHFYAYMRICSKTNTNRDELNDQWVGTIKALELQLSSNYVGQSLDALRGRDITGALNAKMFYIAAQCRSFNHSAPIS
jgi:hypothetical protein